MKFKYQKDFSALSETGIHVRVVGMRNYDIDFGTFVVRIPTDYSGGKESFVIVYAQRCELLNATQDIKLDEIAKEAVITLSQFLIWKCTIVKIIWDENNYEVLSPKRVPLRIRFAAFIAELSLRKHSRRKK